MGTTVKAIALARELKDALTKQVSATMPVATDSFDSDGNPVLTLSKDATPATTEKVVVIRVAPITWASKDILGLDSQVFTPHVIEICTEANPADGAGADILTPVELLPVLAEICKRGTQVKWYVSDAGDVPATTQMVAAKLKATYADLYWNVLKAQ